MISPEQFQRLIPVACRWAEMQEKIILRDGTPLDADQLADARRLGIMRPERIRVLRVNSIPAPEPAQLLETAQVVGLFARETAGMTLRYGIFLQSDAANDRLLLAHELAHVLQYERLGGFRAFMERYLFECVAFGYPNTPLEQEAGQMAESLCNLRAA
jgi:hypothetical protein